MSPIIVFIFKVMESLEMMFTQKNLMTVCCAAVLAFGLAACGSSSDDVKVMDTVDGQEAAEAGGTRSAACDMSMTSQACGPPKAARRRKRRRLMRPDTLDGGLTTANDAGGTVRGGKVKRPNTARPTANTYAKATWPVPCDLRLGRSVWERESSPMDSVESHHALHEHEAAKTASRGGT